MLGVRSSDRSLHIHKNLTHILNREFHTPPTDVVVVTRNVHHAVATTEERFANGIRGRVMSKTYSYHNISPPTRSSRSEVRSRTLTRGTSSHIFTTRAAIYAITAKSTRNTYPPQSRQAAMSASQSKQSWFPRSTLSSTRQFCLCFDR